MVRRINTTELEEEMLNLKSFILSLIFYIYGFECNYERKVGQSCNSYKYKCEEGLACVNSICVDTYAKPYERCGGWGYDGN